MEKVDFIVAEVKEIFSEQIENALKKEQSENNQYGSYYNVLYNSIFQCAGEQPFDVTEVVEGEVANYNFE